MSNRWMERSGWLAAGMVLGGALSAVAASRVDTLYRKLEILAEVFGQIENQYVEATSPTELVYGAAQGAVSRLDGHSAFFSPEEYRDLLDVTEGEYAGIGVEISIRAGVTEVIAVFDNSPAQRAGLRTADEIIAVDDTEIEGVSVETVQALLRGPAGTKVVLTLRHPDRAEPWTFTLVRSWIRVAPIEARPLEPGLEYVRIKSFARRVAHDLETQLERQPPKRGLVLDLRGNPGGLFDEAIAVSDVFLDDGPIVSASGKGGRIIERHTAHKNGTQADYPIAVLIDGGSASAAEIVAGALHDRGRARLFGTRSYGKGSVQSILDLSDGSGLKLTVARYITPSGARIDGLGIDPDQEVEFVEGEDAPLEAAREWLKR
jgi:carboxyl-terminal processing protease